MINLVYRLASLLFFDITLLYYYNNLSSSLIFCLCSGDMFLSPSFVTVSELFCGEVFKTFIILSAILLLIKSPVVSPVF